MGDCVVDTSVAFKWVVPEADSADAVRVFAGVTATGGTLHLLDIARVEAANVIRTRVRRRLLAAAEADDAFAALQRLPTRTQPALPLLPAAFALAVRFDIAVYDALFVAAVQHLGCDGVTADGPLVRAVGAAVPAIKLLRDW